MRIPFPRQPIEAATHSDPYADLIGVCACPGEQLATLIARVGIEQLLHSGVQVPKLAENISYRSSVNTRIPLFGGEKA